MAYVVDRVVICDAFREPDRHYGLLAGGRSKLVAGRRPSMRFLASAKDAKGGIAGVIGKENRPRLEPRVLDEDPELSYHAPRRVTENDLFDNILTPGGNESTSPNPERTAPARRR